MNSTYTSQTTQIIIDINNSDLNIDTIWYRIYNNTDAAWVDSSNLTWTTPTNRTLGKGGVYTLYVWANDTHGRYTSASPVTFTMIHGIIYSGNRAFTYDFVVGPYQKVIFQDGRFSSTTWDVYIQGSLEMHNVIWNSNLFLYDYSNVTATNTTCNNLFYMYGNGVASLDNMTFSGIVHIYDNSVITLSNSLFKSQSYGHDNARVTIINSTLLGELRSYEWAEITAINSTMAWITSFLVINDGTWIIDQGNLSGTGSAFWNKITLINSACYGYGKYLDIYASSKVVINDSLFESINCYSTANVSIFSSSSNWIEYNDNSIGSLDNVTAGYLILATNQTVYMRDTTINWRISKCYRFYQGNIVGFNDTFIGALNWTNTKIIYGPGNFIAGIDYSYGTYNQVDLTINTTTLIWRVQAYDNSNAYIYNSTLFSVSCNTNSNVTLYYSTVDSIYVYSSSNITLYNSSAYRMYLFDTSSFASIIQYSHVTYLYNYGPGSYYKSPDSVIDYIY